MTQPPDVVIWTSKDCLACTLLKHHLQKLNIKYTEIHTHIFPVLFVDGVRYNSPLTLRKLRKIFKL